MATILVVDDDPSIRELLALHLTRAGYTVTLAEDGLEAGHMILNAVPDLLLCDVMMPHMDGITLVEALRRDPTLPRIPVVFLTSSEEVERRCRNLGGEFLTKPVRADRLLAIVAEQLQRQ